MERGRKLKTGIVEVREEFDEMMMLSVLRHNCGQFSGDLAPICLSWRSPQAGGLQ